MSAPQSSKRQRVQQPELVPDELSGLALAEAFSAEVVQPLIKEHFPSLQYASALIGPGSEVLGFDDAISRDHDWGPRLMLFLRPADCRKYGTAISAMLRHGLPRTFRGHSCNFEQCAEDKPGVGVQGEGVVGDVNHRVVVHTVEEYMIQYLGVNPLVGLLPKQWLSIPQQKLRTVIEGAVFCDTVGELTAVRSAVAAYFPRDVWLYMIHAGYVRLRDLSHLMGRCGQTGDELGSRVIAAQLVRDVMHLCFLLERTFAPYPKWFGSAFAKLRCAKAMTPALHAAMNGEDWQRRDEAFVEVYTQVGAVLDGIGIVPPQTKHVVQFWGRPFHVPNVECGPQADFITTHIAAAVEDEELRTMCQKVPIGAAEQHIDSISMLVNPSLLSRLGQAMYAL